jgi:Zn-dependent protease
MLVLVLAIGLHEFGHAKFADLAGDPTPRLQGRVTLNPIKHLDPIGTLFMLVSSLTGFGIGWGKPVIVDPSRMHNPRWDHFVSVLAGPAMNFIQAVVYALVLRILIHQNIVDLNMLGDHPTGVGIFVLFLLMGVVINVSLMLFNLVPIGPLDGHWLVGAFMPDSMRLKWYRFNYGIGMLFFLVLVFIPRDAPYNPFTHILFPLAERISGFLLGSDLA